MVAYMPVNYEGTGKMANISNVEKSLPVLLGRLSKIIGVSRLGNPSSTYRVFENGIKLFESDKEFAAHVDQLGLKKINELQCSPSNHLLAQNIFKTIDHEHAVLSFGKILPVSIIGILLDADQKAG